VHIGVQPSSELQAAPASLDGRVDAGAPAELESAAFSPLAIGIAAALVACVWFFTLGARHLLPADEGRYAEIAREMAASGDWVTIRYNGLKYFEKPPFQFWMTALAYDAFGVGEWQARLWTALSGAAGLAVTAFAAKRWFGARVGLLTALVLLAAPGWNLGSHFSSLDMALSGAFAFIVAGLLLAHHPAASATSSRNWMLVAWVAAAVAVLTKGLIGIVLPGLVVAVYCLATRDFSIFRRLRIGTGLLLMLVIVAPWFVLVSERNPEFARFFFVHEHWERYLSPTHHREGAWWYFIPQLMVGFLPWIGLSWAMAKDVGAKASDPQFRPTLLLGVWAATIFVFFSFSSSKLPGYILPIYPALAILAARALDRLDAVRWRRHVVSALAVVAAGGLATPLLTRLGTQLTPNALFRQFAPWVGAAMALGVAGLATAWRLNSASTLRSIAVYALTFFAVVTVVLRGHETFGSSSSGAALAARVRPVLEPGMPLYSVRLVDHTLPFYLRHTTILVESSGELEFGVEQEPGKWLPSIDAFLARWTSGPRALAVMSPPTLQELRTKHASFFVVDSDVRRVVVANFEPSSR
jgi:4-amino-4-deoxy-L-arabinose transferase-like glycosyltransferase